MQYHLFMNMILKEDMRWINILRAQGKRRENVIENVIEISETSIQKLLPSYSKKKLSKALEIIVK